MITKPLSVRRKDTIDSIIDIVNSSGLPAFVISSIFQDLYNQSVVAMNEEYKRDVTEYANAVKSDNKNKER